MSQSRRDGSERCGQRVPSHIRHLLSDSSFAACNPLEFSCCEKIHYKDCMIDLASAAYLSSGM